MDGTRIKHKVNYSFSAWIPNQQCSRFQLADMEGIGLIGAFGRTHVILIDRWNVVSRTTYNILLCIELVYENSFRRGHAATLRKIATSDDQKMFLEIAGKYAGNRCSTDRANAPAAAAAFPPPTQ